MFDRSTMIAGLLFLSEIKEYQDSAVRLITGDLTLENVKKSPNLVNKVKEFEKLIKTNSIDKETYNKVMQFAEEQLYGLNK